MAEGLFVIVSKVPERISHYTSNLRSFTSNFLFSSDITSFLKRQPYSNLRLILIDNVDEDLDVVEHVTMLRRADVFEAAIVFVIVRQEGSDSGIQALKAGGNDYLAYPLVDRELAARVRMHLNSYAKTNNYFDPDCNLDGVYPLEDRVIIKNSICYITNNIASIKSVSDLSFYVGRSEKDINRAFSTHVGQTAFAYMRAFRIKIAKEMLLKTRFPITQIAQDVGYSSSANFSTAFKSVVGISPKSYRSQALSIK